MKIISKANVCYALSILLVLGFLVKTVMDYSQYNSMLNSAPFRVWVIANAVYFLVPAGIAFVIGFVIRKKTT